MKKKLKNVHQIKGPTIIRYQYNGESHKILIYKVDTRYRDLINKNIQKNKLSCI